MSLSSSKFTYLLLTRTEIINFKKGELLLSQNIIPAYLNWTTLIRFVATDFYPEKI